MGKMFLIYLDISNADQYDWELHSQLQRWLTPPSHPPLMHLALCLPLTGLTNHGRSNQVTEPCYPVSRFEEWLPIPGATYGCARAQQAFAHTYIERMRDLLPNCTKLGSAQQRQTIQVRDFNEYSEKDLSLAAVNASIRAMDVVYRDLKAEPIMGLTRHFGKGYRNEDTLPNRSTSTDTYNGDEMMLNIPDCTCEYCFRISSQQRFPAPEADDGQLPDTDSDEE